MIVLVAVPGRLTLRELSLLFEPEEGLVGKPGRMERFVRLSWRWSSWEFRTSHTVDLVFVFTNAAAGATGSFVWSEGPSGGGVWAMISSAEKTEDTLDR
jgi:hypothetical protein